MYKHQTQKYYIIDSILLMDNMLSLIELKPNAWIRFSTRSVYKKFF